MKFADEYKQISKVSPPIQPKLKTNVRDYVEIVQEWNPISIKSNALFYQFISSSEDENIDLIPDGCINILFKCDERNPNIVLSGIFSKERPITLEADTMYFGFKPYSPAGIIRKDLRLADIVDSEIDLKYYFPELEKLTEEILKASNLKERSNVFLDYAKKYLIDYGYNHELGEYLAIMMCLSKGLKKVNQLVEDIDYTERHCRKRFKEMLGINLTHYNRIMRFQNAIKTLFNNGTNMTDIAYDSGYFDQSHFIKDFKKFTRDSPSRFKNSIL